MNESTPEQKAKDIDAEVLAGKKSLAEVIYICQALSFFFGGIPLLVAIILNYIKRKEVAGTWLESHFDWQIKTVWVALLLVLLGAFTVALGIGVYILIGGTLWTVYRIAYGWSALRDNKPVRTNGFF